MAITPRLKNTLALVALAPGASIVLPHALSNGQRDLDPDIIFLPDEGLAVTASDTTAITVVNNSAVPISGTILVEAWHTIERAFGANTNVNLPVKPYIVTSDADDDSDLNPMSPPEQWVIALFAGEGASSGPMVTQVSTNFPDGIRMIRAGSIVGARARLVAPITAGTVSAQPKINGVAVGPIATIVGAPAGVATAAATAPPGAVPYNAGDLIGMQFSNSAGVLPGGGQTMESWLEVFESL
jgi:hypothetical protein